MFRYKYPEKFKNAEKDFLLIIPYLYRIFVINTDIIW